jgi:ribosomal protein S18 acetylase RimI-like enzyme
VRSAPASVISREKTVSEVKRALHKGLRAFNREKTKRRDLEQVALSVRDADGRIVGGLYAMVYRDWMFVSMLWVDDAFRGQGTGEALIERAETEARALGARGIYLDTLSWQAPGFYRKLGFREIGRLDDIPAGQSRHWMAKQL